MAAAPKRKNWLLRFEATGASPPPMASVVPALIAIIRGAITSPADVKRILKSAPPAALATAAAAVNVTPEMMKIIKSILNPPEMNANQPPAGSIGKIYYKGGQAGWAFGTKNAPKFRRTGQTNLQSEHNGWFLKPRGNSNNFNFERNPEEDLKKEIAETASPDVALGLLAIITGLISPVKASKIATDTPSKDMSTMIGNLGARITELIKSIIRPGNTPPPPPVAGLPNVKNLTSRVLNLIRAHLTPPSATSTENLNITSKLLSLILAGIRPLKKSPSNNKVMANFILAPKFSGSKKGYVFTTRAGFFKNKGNGTLFNFRNVLGASNTNFIENKVGKTGYFLNKGEVRGGIFGLPFGPSSKPNNVKRNYTKMTLKQLLDHLRLYPQNKDAIRSAIYKLFDEELKSARYESRTKRARRLGDLLRVLPRNFSRRGDATVMVIEDIRDSRNLTNLSNFKTNLGRVPNENISRMFDEQKRRLTRKPTETNAEFERRRRAVNENEMRRRRRAVNENEMRRRRRTANENEMRRRRAVGGGYPPPSRGNMYPPPSRGNMYPSPRGNMYPPPPRGNVMAPAPPVLPNNQKLAINNAGGAPQALATVAAVPGGAQEVAKAAEALNETAGNVSQAINIKGASPAAVAAVKKLGGANDAVNVLKGLNTLAQTRKVKSSGRKRRSKSLKPRIAELNRVIEAVKKQKLISLIAHNITKTHNIHPNDEHGKKYYKKVIKANILRKPFAKIVKRAAAKKK